VTVKGAVGTVIVDPEYIAAPLPFNILALLMYPFMGFTEEPLWPDPMAKVLVPAVSEKFVYVVPAIPFT
jgi:hypothetical protein